MDLRDSNCVAYIRVSTERQAVEDRTSLADQERAVRTLASTLGCTIVHVYRDEGASGATAEQRPAFMQLIRDCESAPRSPRSPGLVLVLNDSRFGRFPDPEEGPYWRIHLQKHGWRVQFAEHDDAKDVTTRTLMRAIHGTQSSAYRESVKANARRGIEGAATQGYWASRAPFGYRRHVVVPADRARMLDTGVPKAPDERVKLVPFEPEAEIVREMFQRYASGEHSIASLLEWATVAAPSRRWCRAAIRLMLANPAYVGDVIFGRVPADPHERRLKPQRAESEWYGRAAAHEPLVSRALFDRARARAKLNRARPRAVRSDWLVSGLIRCRCGAKLIGGGGRAYQPSGRFYQCQTRSLPRARRCAHGGTVSKLHLETAVLEVLAKEVGSPKTRRVIERAVDQMIAALMTAPATAARDLDREQRTLETKRDRLVAAVADGTVTSLEAQRKLAEYRRALAELAARQQLTTDRGALRAQLSRERDTMIALASSFQTAIRELKGPALRGKLTAWVRSAVFDMSTRELTIEVRRIPNSMPGMDTDTMASHPEQRSEPVVLRKMTVGRVRRRA
jgi:DNA invertase Pin-like site-specific DNA recombinase